MTPMLDLNKKSISILIFTSGYWRSGFFRRLFIKYANIKLVNPLKENLPKEEINNFDVILWETDITIAPYDFIDEKKLFLFDYKPEGDQNILIESAKKWGIKPAGYLLVLTEKNMNEFGCLPLPVPKLIHPNFHKPKKLYKRKNDIVFLCSGTYIFMNQKKRLPYTIEYKGRTCYNQRIEWAQKLKDNYMLPDNMGLVEPKADYLKKDNIVDLFGCDPELFTNFIEKKDFVKNMMNSKIILAPGGHSRWTYRHLEGLYYKGLVVSDEFVNLNMMPQLPLDAMITVADGEFDPEMISQILSEIDKYQDHVERGYDWVCSTYRAKTLLSKPAYTPATVKSMFNYLVNWFDNRLNTN